ncbi:MAG: MBL fold metallo-hydrolase [Candidatus Tectomicrobia bacterium]|uniref:MBL fold metallo-hydrolase n=1 Tax=Tectimicrobiota bacterium TaxID=2528274 RepID=A0A937W3S2_UNCTE|nr:MBL fold metallo-hydrolase [Candidatus Tectomicrobia bacterium]
MNPFARRTYGTLVRVTERVYLFRNVVNSVIVLGDNATAVVDTQVNEPMAERLLQQARALSDKPLRYAINTHYHWDHTAGNHVCNRAGAMVVSSALTRTFLATRGARQRAFLASRGFELGPLPYLADDVVTEPRAFDLGNQRLEVQHLGPAESDDAIIVHLPQEGCVIAGDTVMTGSFPIFGQPVMNEGLMGTTSWLDTLSRLEALQPRHILPGHGPVAQAHDLALFQRLERYFLDEVGARVARGMPLPALLADLESQLPAWITTIPVVWGTPRYAILRVYRGLVEDPAGEPGWQHYKPSAIPPGDATRVQAASALPAVLSAWQAMARECAEGGDVGSAIAIARQATVWASTDPAAWVFLAETLNSGSSRVASVLEKGDFFVEARQALQQAFALEPQYVPAHLALGRFLVMMAYRNGGTPTPGMEHLRQVIASQPLQAQGPTTILLAQAHCYLGMGYRTLGDEPQAMACFQAALSYMPTFQPALLACQH